MKSDESASFYFAQGGDVRRAQAVLDSGMLYVLFSKDAIAQNVLQQNKDHRPATKSMSGPFKILLPK